MTWTPRARSDIKAIHDYVARDAPLQAKRIVREIKRKADILVSLPHLGKVVPEVGVSSIREISALSWRVIYLLRQETVSVLTVVHKRQQLVAAEIKDTENI